jgi:predicted dehydrogenase
MGGRLMRIGIIGAGWPGERHTEAYQALPGVDVVAVSDTNEERRHAFARRFDVPRAYGSYDELVSDPDIDAVSIGLPNHLHCPATILALEAGKHVLCEKPPALTLAEAKRMAKVARERGLVLSYALQRRFNTATVELARRIEQGAVGEVYHARAVWTRTWGVPGGVGGWFTDPARSGGGALIDIGVHVLDMAWYLMGRPEPLTVSGQVHNRYPEQTRTDDSAFALVRFEAGRGLHLETSWVLTQEDDHMAVYLYGTRGGARLDDHSFDIYTVGAEGKGRSGQTFPNRSSGFVGEVGNFVGAVRGEQALLTTPEDGVQLMRMLEGIYRSAADAREVSLHSELGAAR